MHFLIRGQCSNLTCTWIQLFWPNWPMEEISLSFFKPKEGGTFQAGRCYHTNLISLAPTFKKECYQKKRFKGGERVNNTQIQSTAKISRGDVSGTMCLRFHFFTDGRTFFKATRKGQNLGVPLKMEGLSEQQTDQKYEELSCRPNQPNFKLQIYACNYLLFLYTFRFWSSTTQ